MLNYDKIFTMREIKVSVIIPVFERFEQFSEAVESVFRQTFKNSEIIVVDDGSKDKRIEWFSSVNKINYVKIEHTGMPGVVRNIGVEASRGKYIAFLDSDDLWNIKKLEMQYDFFKRNPHYRIVHTREIWIEKGKLKSQKKQKHKREGNIFDDALKKCIVGPSTVMMERTLFDEFGGFREDLEIAEDYEFWLRILSKYEIGYLDFPLTIKRAGKWFQLSKKYDQIEIFRIKGLKKLVEEGFFEGEKLEKAKKELLRKIDIYKRGLLKRGKTKESILWEKYQKRFVRK